MRKYRVSILVLLVMLMLLVVAACDDNNNQSTPIATKATDVAEPEEALTLVVNAPQDEAVVNTSHIAISGTTRSDAVVSINGVITDVDAQGNFSGEANLSMGPNLVEVVASDFYGNEESVMLTVMYAAALPLTITEPLDGAVVKSSTVIVRGESNPDAVVSVNGDMMDVDVSGGFSTTITLEEGPNLIEVVASDFEGNTTTVMTTVMLVP